MSKSGENEIIDSRINDSKGFKPTDRFMHCIILNATDEILSNLKQNCVLKIRMNLSDASDLIKRSNLEYKPQNKQADFVVKPTKNGETPREKVSLRNATSSIGSNVISGDAGSNKINKDTVDAFAKQFASLLHSIQQSADLPRVVKDFAQLRVVLRYAEKASPECGCVLRSVGTQSGTASPEFSSKMNPDVPAKGYEKKRNPSFFPEKEIANVSNALATERRPVRKDLVAEDTTHFAPKSVMSTTHGTEEKTFGNKKSLISPIIDPEKKLNHITLSNVTTNTVQFFPVPYAKMPQNSSPYSVEASLVSTLVETLDTKVPALPLSEEMRKNGDERAISVKYTENSNSPDTAAITAAVTNKMPERKQGEEKFLLVVANKDTSVNNKTAIITVPSAVTDSAEEPSIQNSTSPAQDMPLESIGAKNKTPRPGNLGRKDTEVRNSSTGEPELLARDTSQESVQIKHETSSSGVTCADKKTDEVESSPVGKPTQPAKDMFQESVQSTCGMQQCEKTGTIKDIVVETSPAGEEPTQLTKDTFQDSTEAKYKVPRSKKIRTIMDTGNGTSPANEPTPPAKDTLQKSQQALQTKRKTPRSKKHQMVRGIESNPTNAFFSSGSLKTAKRSRDRPKRSATEIRQDYRQPRIPQSKCCSGATHYNTSRMSLRSEARQHAALEYVCYPSPRDPCIIKCSRGYWWWGGTCNANNHGKYGAAVGNASHTHTRCNGDTGYYCPHLNDIDNCRTGHCHYNDGRSLWNDDRHYGRS